MDNLAFMILIGIGATALMDFWSFLRKQFFNIPSTNWGMVGRWIAYMRQGKFHHINIAESNSIHSEKFIGWTAHYLIGIGYAALLVGTCGEAWINNPSIGPALSTGVATLVAPFFIMQPGMGAGIAASRSLNPNSVRLQSVISHTVFGFGLFLSALLIKNSG